MEEIIIKEELFERLKELKKSLSLIEHELLSAPKGSLSIKYKKEKPYYYQQCFDSNLNQLKVKYISKKNTSLIHQLAQKSYNRSVKPFVEKEIKSIEQFLQDSKENDIDLIYDNYCESRKEWVIPIQTSVKERITQWVNEKKETNTYYQENLIYETSKGEYVRSKSEMIIADILYQNKEHILYKYERPLEIMINGKKTIIYPDFTIINLKTGKITYWEHAGKIGDEKYGTNFARKINTYIENEIFPGTDLIISYETLNCPLDPRIVRKIVNELIVK